MKVEKIYEYGNVKVFVYREWPIFHYKEFTTDFEEFMAANKKFKTLEEATKAIDKIIENEGEPEFVLPLENGNKNRILHEFIDTNNDYDVEVIAISPFVPVSQNYANYGYPRRPDFIVPGFGYNPGFTSYSTNAFELLHPEKTIHYGNLEFHADSIVYKSVPFREGLADLRIPWNERKAIIEKFSIKDIPKRHIEKFEPVPFSRKLQNSIKRILIDDTWKSKEYYFVGWDKETFYSITLIKRKHDESKVWYLDYAPLENIKNPWTQSIWEISGRTKSIKIENPEVLKDVVDVYKLIDFLS